jgi:hypothetical protein
VVDADAVHHVAAAIIRSAHTLVEEQRASSKRKEAHEVLCKLRNVIEEQHDRIWEEVDQLAACCPPDASFRGAPVCDICALDDARADIIQSTARMLGCPEMVTRDGASGDPPRRFRSIEEHRAANGRSRS